MKIKISSLLIAVLLTLPLSAQKGQDQLKKAKMAFNVFMLNTSDKSKLLEATHAIDLAIKDPVIIKEAKVWLMRGDIYNEIANQRAVIRELGIGDPSELPKVKYPALEALEAFKKARSLAGKKYETKGALEGLRTVQSNLSNEGVFAFDDKDYKGAYEQFNQVIEAHKILKADGEDSILDGEGSLDEQQYITGLAALNSGLTTEAKVLFDELYKKKYDKPLIYEALYKLAITDENADITQVYAYLEEGRKRYPDDVGLLFAEINHFLRTNQLDELVSKLKSAIEKEPENISLYNTLGNVYDNLYQREAQGGDPDLENLYFNDALNYYNQALKKDPDNISSVYSIGALYFNKAALETKVLMTLGDDFSSEGIRKYEAKQAQIMEIFDKALPYFQKSESLDPNDINSLIALKEIYARKDDIRLSNEFKTRLENVQNGGQNASSYFSN